MDKYQTFEVTWSADFDPATPLNRTLVTVLGGFAYRRRYRKMLEYEYGKVCVKTYKSRRNK